jgi:hypothetical protein
MDETDYLLELSDIWRTVETERLTMKSNRVNQGRQFRCNKQKKQGRSEVFCF